MINPCFKGDSHTFPVDSISVCVLKACGICNTSPPGDVAVITLSFPTRTFTHSQAHHAAA